MKRFSAKWFVIATLLHLVASNLWMSSALSASFAALDAEKHGMPVPNFPLSLTVLSWILVPIPRLLAPHFHFGPAHYLYYLILPWSLFVGVCFGFMVAHLSTWRHQSPNQALEPTASRSDA
jgi:hypothetical protein